jgi:hypothetical protein
MYFIRLCRIWAGEMKRKQRRKGLSNTKGTKAHKGKIHEGEVSYFLDSETYHRNWCAPLLRTRCVSLLLLSSSLHVRPHPCANGTLVPLAYSGDRVRRLALVGVRGTLRDDRQPACRVSRLPACSLFLKANWPD